MLLILKKEDSVVVGIVTLSLYKHKANMGHFT